MRKVCIIEVFFTPLGNQMDRTKFVFKVGQKWRQRNGKIVTITRIGGFVELATRIAPYRVLKGVHAGRANSDYVNHEIDLMAQVGGKGQAELALELA